MDKHINCVFLHSALSKQGTKQPGRLKQSDRQAGRDRQREREGGGGRGRVGGGGGGVRAGGMGEGGSDRNTMCHDVALLFTHTHDPASETMHLLYNLLGI